MNCSHSTKLIDILFGCLSLMIAYLSGVAIAAGEMRYKSISWKDAYLWPMNALIWLNIAPVVFIFFVSLVASVLIAWNSKRSRLPFRLGMGLFCFTFVMWFKLTLGFHD